jgi:flagellar biosynthesis protein FliQ
MPIYLTLLWQALSAELAALTPIIAILLVTGIAAAILQAGLQIEDTTFSLLPRLFVMLGLPLFGGAALMRSFEHLAIDWISHAGALVRLAWN